MDIFNVDPCCTEQSHTQSFLGLPVHVPGPAPSDRQTNKSYGSI